MKTWGATLILALFFAPGLACADDRVPEAGDLIGLLLDDPIEFVLTLEAHRAVEEEPAADTDDAVAVPIAAPVEPVLQHAELAASALDITYTFAHPDSLRRSGADR